MFKNYEISIIVGLVQQVLKNIPIFVSQRRQDGTLIGHLSQDLKVPSSYLDKAYKLIELKMLAEL